MLSKLPELAFNARKVISVKNKKSNVRHVKVKKNIKYIGKYADGL